MPPRAVQILLIEDNPADIDLSKAALREWRILNELSIAEDGEEAMAYLRKEGKYANASRPDLIFLDLNLPKKDGRQVLKEIKSDRILKTIPVIIVSSSDADIDILKTYGMGANCYIIKPVGLNNFLNIISSVGDFWFNVVTLPPKELTKQFFGQTVSNYPPVPHQQQLGNTLTVLVVEDTDEDARYVREILAPQKQPTFSLIFKDRLASAIEALQTEKIDVILLDLNLPDSQGIKTYTDLAAKFPSIAIVVATGLDDSEMALQVIRSGAQDYIVKNNFDGNLLSRILQYAVERNWLEQEQNVLLARESAARTDAEKAIQGRDEFLSIASHELKTPITSLRLQSQILLKLIEEGNKEEIFEKNKRLAQILDNQTARLSKLIENLLDVSRINAGKLMLEFSDVDLNEVVNDLLERSQADLNKANCKVILNAAANVIGHWDRYRIEQLITNLLTNAMRYGKGKPIEINISQTDEYAKLSIKDNGIGIKKEDLSRMFNRFEQILPKAKVGGLGLGLYIVQQITDAHKGVIRVDSEIDKGSTFTVRLPLRPTAQQTIRHTPEAELHP